MIRSLALPALLIMLLGFAACAPAGETRTAQRGPLTSDEIREAGLSGTALEAVQHLRPQWLRTRSGGGIRVYVDGSRVSQNTSGLAGISVQQVGRIERMSASEATTRYGTVAGGHPEGAIIVTSAR